MTSPQLVHQPSCKVTMSPEVDLREGAQVPPILGEKKKSQKEEKTAGVHTQKNSPPLAPQLKVWIHHCYL